MWNTKLRWGIKRGVWNFIYFFLPLILFCFLGWLVPIGIRGYFLGLAALAAVVISVVTSVRMKKLVRDEVEYIKVHYEKHY